MGSKRRRYSRGGPPHELRVRFHRRLCHRQEGFRLLAFVQGVVGAVGGRRLNAACGAARASSSPSGRSPPAPCVACGRGGCGKVRVLLFDQIPCSTLLLWSPTFGNFKGPPLSGPGFPQIRDFTSDQIPFNKLLLGSFTFGNFEASPFPRRNRRKRPYGVLRVSSLRLWCSCILVAN